MKNAVVRIEESPIKTYIWDRPSRYPILFGGGYRYVYPYTMEDQLLHRSEDRAYRKIILENDLLKITILPELGGHLWSAHDKVSGRELFYNNQVVKPGLIALRGAWCATGIEWNFPIGHSVSTVSPVDCATFENADGSVTAVIGDLDRTTRMKWTVKITLRPGELAFSIDTVLSNPTGYPHRYMYWENAAVHATEGLQFISPARVAWTWGGKTPFPVVDGVDKSWYISHPRSIDYFMLGLGQDYFGYYDHKRRFGAVHLADYHLMPGKKFFTWGMAEHARSWEKNLTDDDGPYIELQCGLTPTQASFDFFPPHSARRWDEMWYPIGDLGCFVQATRAAALHLSDRFEKPPFPSETEVAVVTTRAYSNAVVRVAAPGRTLLNKTGVDFAPGVPVRWKVALPKGAREMSVRVSCDGSTLVEYSTSDWRKIRELPYEPPAGLWRNETGSPERLVRAAVAWLKWFEYGKALRLIDKALKRRPGFAEAHYWKGNILFDLSKYAAAARELSKVTRRSENYATARFLIGEMHRYAGRFDRARGIADELVRCKASTSLGLHLTGLVALCEGDFAAAARAFGRIAASPGAAPHSLALYSAALRRLGRTDDALAAARRAVEIDPLDFMALNELELLGRPSGRDARLRGQVESFIELASYYENARLFDDAAAVLEHYRTAVCRRKCSPLVFYHLAWANKSLGRRAEAAAFFDMAAKAVPDHAFPFRREDMLALEAALERNDADSLAHHLLGCFLAWRQHEDAVLPHWNSALKGLSEYPVLLRNIGLYYQSREDHRRAISFYARAIAAAPADDQLYAEADEVHAKVGRIKQRIAFLEAGLRVRPKSQKIRQLLAQCYYYAGEYDRALAALMNVEFDHWEGDRRAHHIYVLSHMDKGKNLLKAKDYYAALDAFAMAMEYPPNLKVGKPAFPRHAPQLYLSAVAYEQLGREDTALELLRQGGEEIHEGWEGSVSEEGYYKGLCLSRLGRSREAQSIYRHMTKGVEHYGFPAWYNDFIKGLAYQGLEDWKKAIRFFESALSADRANSKIKYHLHQARKHRQAGL